MSRPRKLKMATIMANEITSRAGDFLERAFPGPSKDKRVAQALKISPDMAGLLRRGRGWTAERISQVWKIYGQDFPRHVFGLPIVQSDMMAELADLRAEIAAQREEIAHVASRIAALPMARVESQTVQRAGNAAERSGGLSRDEGEAAGRTSEVGSGARAIPIEKGEAPCD